MNEIFKNTFASTVENKELSVDNIIRLLFFGVVKHKDLPENIQIAVDAEMARRNKQSI